MMNKSLFDDDQTYQLQGFGPEIGTEPTLVVSSNSANGTTNSTNRRARGRAADNIHNTKQQQTFTTYRDHDVLFGRGGLTNHHPGNQVYRRFIEDGKPAYKALRSSMDKRAFLNTIYSKIVDTGAKFLMKQQRKGETTTTTKMILWEEVPKPKALGKIRQALTEAVYHKKDSKRKRKRTSSSSVSASESVTASKCEPTPPGRNAPPNSPSSADDAEGPFVPDPHVFTISGGEWIDVAEEEEKRMLDSFDFDLNTSGHFFLDGDNDNDDVFTSDSDNNSNPQDDLSDAGSFSAPRGQSIDDEELYRQLEASLAHSIPQSPHQTLSARNFALL